jgi:phosphatidylserine/phosphatidylglycerophosphate/cardiolipin synthase-like enzyme
MATNTPFEVNGTNNNALFSLKVYRGEGMSLLAMNWKNNEPTPDFVGFSIEYKEPNGDKFYAIKNRLSFLDEKGKIKKGKESSLLSPIQKFRWVHFPRNADIPGNFTYKVNPVFMNNKEELSYGEPQIVEISLYNETYPDLLNVAFTRGFVTSQAFVDYYEKNGDISTLLPSTKVSGLEFKPTHPDAANALEWMGFEATKVILELLDSAIKDNANIKMIAFDFDLPDLLSRLILLEDRLEIIIDDSGTHNSPNSDESLAAAEIIKHKGKVKRHHMNQLQHNKMIIVDGNNLKAAICGSTNFSWRGFYVQSNNAIVLKGEAVIQPFLSAFEEYWKYDSVVDFGITGSAVWNKLQLNNIDAKISFSPHSDDNALLDSISEDIKNKTSSSLLFSLAFLWETKGCIKDAIKKNLDDDNIFVYGISDRKVGGLDLQKPGGNISPVYPSEISKNLPEPFKSEPKGGAGVRMHHKFVVIDFDKPTARVYLGSYNFSVTADKKNGENLLLIKDRKIVVSYMIEALRIFDHYHFRVAFKESKETGTILHLFKPSEVCWWKEYYSDPIKIKDRLLFSTNNKE